MTKAETSSPTIKYADVRGDGMEHEIRLDDSAAMKLIAYGVLTDPEIDSRELRRQLKSEAERLITAAKSTSPEAVQALADYTTQHPLIAGTIGRATRFSQVSQWADSGQLPPTDNRDAKVVNTTSAIVVFEVARHLANLGYSVCPNIPLHDLKTVFPRIGQRVDQIVQNVRAEFLPPEKQN